MHTIVSTQEGQQEKQAQIQTEYGLGIYRFEYDCLCGIFVANIAKVQSIIDSNKERTISYKDKQVTVTLDGSNLKLVSINVAAVDLFLREQLVTGVNPIIEED